MSSSWPQHFLALLVYFALYNIWYLTKSMCNMSKGHATSFLCDNSIVFQYAVEMLTCLCLPSVSSPYSVYYCYRLWRFIWLLWWRNSKRDRWILWASGKQKKKESTCLSCGVLLYVIMGVLVSSFTVKCCFHDSLCLSLMSDMNVKTFTCVPPFLGWKVLVYMERTAFLFLKTPSLSVCLCFVCVVSLLFSVTLTLFQRRRRSAFMKRTAKSVKPKAKSYKFLTAKQSAAKKLAAKKKRHGYQATAPAKAKAYLGVKVPVDPVRTHQDISSVTKGKSLMLVWMLPNSPCPLSLSSLPDAPLDSTETV